MAATLPAYPRYHLGKRIGTGSMGEIFQAHDRLTDQMVALKRVHRRLPEVPARLEAECRRWIKDGQKWRPFGTRKLSQPGSAVEPATSPRFRSQLTREFQTLVRLRHPHVVSVLDHGFDRHQQPFFVMELLHDALPLDQIGCQLSRTSRVELLLQLLQALTYLHCHGVLHRDLKPSNILVVPGPSGRKLKLLDFGLALLAHQARGSGAEVAGSVGYMAPEAQGGAPLGPAADLFAVGVLAHELLLGEHLLARRPMYERICGFVGTGPIFTADERLGPALSVVLSRALDRDPGQRYADAALFAKDLACAAGLPPPAETVEIRESFISAAPFVARKAELNVLQGALTAALGGRGALWLVGGATGVGKSRLLEELRTEALVRGMRVVCSHAVCRPTSAFTLWQGALLPLCLDPVRGEPGAQALSAIASELAAQLDRSTTSLGEPSLASARLLPIIESLLHAQAEPLLLLLEDLQWADSGSLLVLQQLAGSCALSARPVLIVGSYRDDERPALPGELPFAKILLVPQLKPDEIAELGTAMLGEAGKRQEVVALLQRDSLGNARAISQIVRALAEQAGSLERLEQSVPAGTGG